MNETLVITSSPLGQMLLFAGVSLLATIVAYMKLWATDKDSDTNIWAYLTGDGKAVVRAFISLLGLWVGGSGFAVISGNTDLEIIIAAIGLSFLVPQRADKMMLERAKIKREDNKTSSKKIDITSSLSSENIKGGDTL